MVESLVIIIIGVLWFIGKCIQERIVGSQQDRKALEFQLMLKEVYIDNCKKYNKPVGDYHWDYRIEELKRRCHMK